MYKESRGSKMEKRYYIVLPSNYYVKSRVSITPDLRSAKFFDDKTKADKYRAEAGWTEGVVVELETATSVK